jgi:ribosomal protein L21E
MLTTLPEVGCRVGIDADALYHSACPDPESYRGKFGFVIGESELVLLSDPCYRVRLEDGGVLDLYLEEMISC